MASTSTTTHRNAAAYHAAGHAFMALHEKVPFSDVSIAACGASLPADPILPAPILPGPNAPHPASTDVVETSLIEEDANRVDSLVRIAFAGVIAEQIFSGQRDGARSRASFRRATVFAQALHPHPILCKRYLNAALTEVVNVLRHVEGWGQSPWNQVAAIAERLIIDEVLTVAEVRQVIADQSSVTVSVSETCLRTAECSAAEWLESEVDAVADAKDDAVEAFESHKYDEPDRLFPKEELQAVQDRLKAGDVTALIAWGGYFQVMASMSAGAAFKKVPNEKKYDELWDEYYHAGLLEALAEGKRLMDVLAFRMWQPEHYTWRAIKNAIAEVARLDRRYARNHKGYDYLAAKGDPSHLPPVESERDYGLTLEGIEDDCEFDSEKEVFRLLKQFNGDEKRVAKLLGRATHVIRDLRRCVEERSLRQKRTVFKIDPDHTIEPVSLESIPRIKLEFEEINVCCKTELEEFILYLMCEHCDFAAVASISGLSVMKVKNMLGTIGVIYARRMRARGFAMPNLEKQVGRLKFYRPKSKQANDWPRENPLSFKSLGKSRKARLE